MGSKTLPDIFFDSVGKMRENDTLYEIKLVPDPSFPRESDYEVGEIRVRMPYQGFQGYWRNPELTAQAFDDNGFIRTKDLAYFDEKGFLFIMGRVDDAIKHRITGRRIFPGEVEG